MRVAGRLATGTGVALALLLTILAWDVALVDQLAGVNQSLSKVNFRASTTTLEMTRLLNQMDEFTRKFYVTQDPAYQERLGELRTAFASDLAGLQGLDLAPEVRRSVAGLASEWETYWRHWARFRLEQEPLSSEEAEAIELEGLARLRGELDTVSESAQTLVLEQALRSAEVSGRARELSWSIAAAALLLSLLILWWTIRSINRPLTQLTKGTQAVAEGEFSVRLETRGSDELSRLASSFNQMVRRLGEAERAKKDFLSHVSHELKTPLASMHETNELLLEEIPGPLNQKQRRFLELNLDSSRRLGAMISKLLDLSRMEAGAMEYEFRRQDLAEILRTVVAGFEARALEERKRIVVQAPPTAVEVDCDVDRMIQVIQNLLDNALKFSPQDSVIEVRVLPTGVAKEEPEWADEVREDPAAKLEEMILLEVADQGPGVPESQRPLIFRRFHQIESAATGYAPSGVGLGLAICGEIAQAHQGWIGAARQ